MGPLLIPDCNRLEYKQLVKYNIVQLGPSTFLPNPNYLKVDNFLVEARYALSKGLVITNKYCRI